MSLEAVFTAEAREAIRQATAQAEGRTSGEIVPYIVGRADPHAEIAPRAALLGALVSAATAGLVYHLGGFWGSGPLAWVVVGGLIGGLAAYFAIHWLPSCSRALVHDDVLERRVQLRAESAFLHEEVFNTRDRTGILVFLALFEHRAVILADTGIHEAVPADAWETLVDDLVHGIQEDRSVEALVGAITACGDLLEHHRVERRPDDVDELPNELRFKES